MCTDLVVNKKKVIQQCSQIFLSEYVWNTIPENIKCLYSFDVFKDKIKR